MYAKKRSWESGMKTTIYFIYSPNGDRMIACRTKIAAVLLLRRHKTYKIKTNIVEN